MSLQKADDHDRGLQGRAERMLVGVPGLCLPHMVAEHSLGTEQGVKWPKDLGHWSQESLSPWLPEVGTQPINPLKRLEPGSVESALD